MKKGACFLVCNACLILIIQSCKNNRAANAVTETSDTVHFYPVMDYFKTQVKEVDSFAVFIYKITINNNGSKDSTVLNQEQFNQWAQAFLAYDISDKKFHKYYKENIFLDETTHSYTFNYTAMKNTLPLQTVDILLDEDDQHVKRVFINKVISAGDSTVTEKAGWKTGSSFFINRIVDYPGNRTTTQQNIIVWHNQP